MNVQNTETVTAEDFLKAVFHSYDVETELPVIVSPYVPKGETKAQLLGWPADKVESKHTHYSSGLYERASLFKNKHGQTRARRTDDHWTGLVAVVPDDVGETKPERVAEDGTVVPAYTVKTPTLEPSFIVETKPGSQQYGYILEVPLRDEVAVREILESLKAAGYSDKGASTQLGRVFRLPGSKPQGKEHTAKLVSWHPERRFNAATLLAQMGVPKVAVNTPRSAPHQAAPFPIDEHVLRIFGEANDDLGQNVGQGKWSWVGNVTPEKRREVVESALGHVVGATYNQWRNVAMSLSTLADDWAQEVCEAWSAKQPGYGVAMDDDNATLWGGFRDNWRKHLDGTRRLPDPRTMGALFYDAVENGWDPAQFTTDAMAAADNAPDAPDAPVAGTRLPGLPSGYRYKDGGIYRLGEPKENDDGTVETEEKWVCDIFHMPAATLMTGSNTDPDTGMLLHLTGLDKKVREVDVSMELLAAPVELSRFFFRHSVSHISQQELVLLLKMWKPTKLISTVRKPGWSSDAREAFLAPMGHTVGKQGTVRPHRLIAGRMNVDKHTKGTLEEWRNKIGALCVDNPAAMFGVSFAMAGPLLQVMDLDGGGIHFWRSTTAGKTTIARMMSSVWGGEGYMKKWRGTDNAMENLGEAHNDGVLVMDDMAQADERFIGKVIYMLADRTGKNRMNADDSARENKSWRIVWASTGEKPTREYIKAAGEAEMTGGQAVRLVDIPLPEGEAGGFPNKHWFKDHNELGHTVQRLVLEQCGTAGPAFVEYLIGLDGEGKLKHACDVLRDTFFERLRKNLNTELSAEAKRALNVFVVGAIAGELATKAGITGWTTGAAVNASAQLSKDWLEARGSGRGTEEEATLRALRHCLQTKKNQFEPWYRDAAGNMTPDPKGGIIRDLLGWYIETPQDEPDEYWFAEGVLAEELKADELYAAKRIEEAGLLKPADGRNLKVRAPYKLLKKRPRLYCVLDNPPDDSGDNGQDNGAVAQEPTAEGPAASPVVNGRLNGSGGGSMAERAMLQDRATRPEDYANKGRSQ